MTKTQQLDDLAAHIKSSKDLWDLHSNLTKFDNLCRKTWPDSEDDIDGGYFDQLNTENELKTRGLDICELPTFGGDWPKSTVEVWSWDMDHILTGIGACEDWEIRARR